MRPARRPAPSDRAGPIDATRLDTRRACDWRESDSPRDSIALVLPRWCGLKRNLLFPFLVRRRRCFELAVLASGFDPMLDLAPFACDESCNALAQAGVRDKVRAAGNRRV